MIIRKPYAFLIKNFRKIHIFLLILSMYVAYKLFDTSSFISDFMQVGIYDLYANPVSRHISSLLMFSIFLLIVGTASIAILLIYKKKPWKLYLVPLVEFLVLFFVLMMIRSFFAGYTETVETTDLRLSRDLLYIFTIGIVPAIGVYVIRVFGIDIKKFNFNSDQEFLELSDSDREEVEISLSVDINTFKRLYRRLIRNISYIYQEHKLICRCVIAILTVIILFNGYKFYLNNRSYRTGQLFSANGYTITVKDAYYTDKDSGGNVISKKNSFLIVRVNVKNSSSETRKLNTDNFHLKNKTKDYVSTHREYEKQFADLGVCYDSVKELSKDSSLDFIIVFRVSNYASKNGYALYYQELTGNNKLRKIRLKVKDLSKINDAGTFKLKDDLVIDNFDTNDTISFNSYEFVEDFTYKVRKCSISVCDLTDEEYVAKDGYKVLKISFGSTEFESKNMIDFFDMYGKIGYKDTRGEMKTYDIDTAIKNYYGKNVYLLLPDYVTETDNLNLIFTVRNNRYTYKIV